MYRVISEILEKYDADVGAAEAHGMAVGMLCVGLQADAANWLHELFSEEHALPDDAKSLLLNLFDQTRELLDPETEEFVFDLFLPDEDEALSDQAEAIRCWCQGFLFGVGYYAESGKDAAWSEDCEEVMRDMVELTKIDSDIDGEEDAMALMEIHEYLRAAVLTVRDQFSDQKHQSLH